MVTDGADRRRFFTRVLHEGSRRAFQRGFSTRVQRGSARSFPRGFSTQVPAPRGLHARVLLSAALVAALSVRSAAQEPTLQEILARAGQYTLKLHEQLAGIVAEETYDQFSRTLGRASSPIDSRRTLKSDFLMVRPSATERYVEFRDVFSVNGQAVRDREERLSKLFLTSTYADRDLLREIISESARYNLGDIPRNVNTPMLTLFFLHPDVQSQFRFKRARRAAPALTGQGTPGQITIRDSGVFRVTTEMWVIEFRETGRPTIIRTNNGRNFPAQGRLWIAPDSGAVLMSELAMDNGQVTATINVSYQSEPLLGFLVPVEMRERYRARTERVEGVATYGRFRQFQVKTGEIIKPPP
jgi:hypothetical protein